MALRFGQDQVEQITEETAEVVTCEWCSMGEGCIVVQLEMMYTLAWDRGTRRVANHIVEGARVTIGGATCVSNQLGRAYFKGLPDGTHTLQLRAAVGQQSAQRAGPPLAAGINPPPTQMLRGARGSIRIEDGKVTAATIREIDTDHAWVFSVEDYMVTVDWKADFRLAHDHGRSPRPDWVGGLRGVTTVICHQTGGPSDENIGSTLNTFLNGNQASAHYVIDVDGFVVKMVPDVEQSHHAGYSILHGRRNVNDFSIGIETVNSVGDTFTDAQYTALYNLIKSYIDSPNYAITRHDIFGHSDIQTYQGETVYSPDRANCPGQLFDWRGLAQRGVGTRAVANLTHQYAVSARYHHFFDESGAVLRAGDGDGNADTPPTYSGTVRPDLQGRNLIAQLQRDLARMGYSISPQFNPNQADDANHVNGQPIDGVFNSAMPKTVDRFRRHFLSMEGEQCDLSIVLALQAALSDRGTP